MAVVPYVVVSMPAGAGNRDTYQVNWPGMVNGDSGQPLDLSAYADRSVQVLGTFGAGGNVRIEGSLKEAPAVDADYGILTDPSSTALDITTAKIEGVLEMTRWIRPRITAGDGTTALTVYMIAKRN